MRHCDPFIGCLVLSILVSCVIWHLSPFCLLFCYICGHCTGQFEKDVHDIALREKYLRSLLAYTYFILCSPFARFEEKKVQTKGFHKNAFKNFFSPTGSPETPVPRSSTSGKSPFTSKVSKSKHRGPESNLHVVNFQSTVNQPSTVVSGMAFHLWERYYWKLIHKLWSYILKKPF